MGRVKIRNRRTKIFASFNPHAPYGARRLYLIIIMGYKLFQSARPIWGASVGVITMDWQPIVSIRTPHMGRVTYVVFNK